MEKIVITIKTGNAAFEEYNAPYEVARILRQLAAEMEAHVGCYDTKLRDINGNFVGRVEIDPATPKRQRKSKADKLLADFPAEAEKLLSALSRMGLDNCSNAVTDAYTGLNNLLGNWQETR